MYLKQIELSGFKSFAQKTVISFVSGGFVSGNSIGITSIVGPNGSGKSNISDAIRWVMGEQSMKSLRGDNSKDVIFSGSDKKGSMSLARVCLVFDNTDKILPVEYDEVIIERKMYRSGESEYIINGARVRLSDVLDILARSGIGKGTYCVVGQGMTDAILNATPTERKLMIEEAAGVSHDQIRKIRAEKKLVKTKENLTRTKELVAQIQPHLQMLKRQSKKAQKSKLVLEKLKSLQYDYFGFVWKNLFNEREMLEKKKLNFEKEVARATRILKELNEKIKKESQKVQKAQVVSKHEDEKRVLYEQMRKADQKVAVIHGKIALEKERKIAEQKVKSIPVDLKYVREKLTLIKQKYQKLHKKLKLIRNVEEISALEDKILSIQTDLDNLYTDAQKKTVALTDHINKEKIIEITNLIKKYEKEVLQSKKERVEIQNKINKLNQKITKEVSQDREARTQFFVLEKERMVAQQQLNSHQNDLNNVKIEIARIEVYQQDLQKEALEDLSLDLHEIDFSKVKDIDKDEVLLKINSLKREYETIGGIDPMIVEEYEEVRQRYEFLTNELSDLEKTIVKLRKIIVEMDKKIHSAFAKAYREIDKEFTKYFRILFNGGNAKLKKIDIEINKRKKEIDSSEENNDLDKSKNIKTEVGVEIIASPPGKKVRQLSLLSGGERSLTSIAMLFAIIAYNPPPFIVLDEVEAALDEANSRRLAKIFKELSNKSQFIIITHNRETMRHSEKLYGVTMGNDGISQILSIELEVFKEKNN